MAAPSRLRAQICTFGLIGAAGYLVDTAVLYLELTLGFGLYLGRALSFLGAVTFTWMFNRRFTFTGGRATRWWRQWLKFATSQAGGALLNLGTYAALVHQGPLFAAHPFLAVAAGSLAGMGVNFLTARRYVFRD